MADRRGLRRSPRARADAPRDAPGAGEARRPARSCHRGRRSPPRSFLLALIGFGGFNAFAALYAREIGMRPSIVYALFGLVVLLVRAFGRKIPDRFGGRSTATGACATISAGLAVMALWGPAGLLVGTVVFAIGQSLATRRSLLAIARTPEAERSAAIGAVEGVGRLGARARCVRTRNGRRGRRLRRRLPGRRRGRGGGPARARPPRSGENRSVARGVDPPSRGSTRRSFDAATLACRAASRSRALSLRASRLPLPARPCPRRSRSRARSSRANRRPGRSVSTGCRTSRPRCCSSPTTRSPPPSSRPASCHAARPVRVVHGAPNTTGFTRELNLIVSAFANETFADEVLPISPFAGTTSSWSREPMSTATSPRSDRRDQRRAGRRAHRLLRRRRARGARAEGRPLRRPLRPRG